MKKKFILIAIILLLVIGYFGYNYVYQDHRDISTENSEYKTTATEIIAEFSKNTQLAQSKYLNKTITIEGQISVQTNKNITLNDAVFCSLIQENTISENRRVSVKGRFIGYDDLLEEIKLDQCSVIKTD